ncbi:Protein-tyrosine phosphatase-like [Trinorchestia longiramus]|nr:Protein-tyrosine phosphatase-like [Trinorchestia longiramus]
MNEILDMLAEDENEQDFYMEPPDVYDLKDKDSEEIDLAEPSSESISPSDEGRRSLFAGGVGTGRSSEWRTAVLDGRHGGHYNVYNVSGRHYSSRYTGGQLVHINWDPKRPPSLSELYQCCISVALYLSADPANVAVVHCMDGRGNSALLCACLLMLCGVYPSFEQPLNMFSIKRAPVVLQPSHYRHRVPGLLMAMGLHNLEEELALLFVFGQQEVESLDERQSSIGCVIDDAKSLDLATGRDVPFLFPPLPRVGGPEVDHDIKSFEEAEGIFSW